MSKINDLHEKANALFAKARALHEEHTEGDRPWAAEEEQQYRALMDEAWKVRDEEKKESRKAELERMEKEFAKKQGSGRRTAFDSSDLYSDFASPDRAHVIEIPRIHQGRALLEQFRIEPGSKAHNRHLQDRREAFRGWLMGGEIGAVLQTDFDERGGYLATPEQLVAELIKEVDDTVHIRRLGRTFTTRAQTLGAIKRTQKSSTFQWGKELDDTETHPDTSLKFGKRELHPHYMSGMIYLSRDLLRSAILPVETLVLEELRRESSELEEQAFITGTGNQQPLGLFTASAEGISTGRDVVGTNSTSAIAADTLRTVKYTLKEQYRMRAQWLFHRDALSQISKLKTTDNQYLWQQGLAAGDPDRLLNLPVIESEWVPNTFTNSAYVGMLGDYSHYWIADSLDLDIQRMVEKYLPINQVAWVMRRKVDAMPQLEEAFVRVQLAA